MTLDEYYQLLGAGQTYVQNAQAADPAWQDWLTSQSNYNLDTAGSVASPTTDYWGQYMATLSPQQQAEFAQTMAQLKGDRWQTSVGNVMQYIPAAVGAVGLAGAAGLLGPSAGFPGTSIFSGLGGVGTAGSGFVGEGALSGIPAWDAAAANAATAGTGTGFIGEGVASGIPAWDTAGAAGAASNLSNIGTAAPGTSGLLNGVGGSVASLLPSNLSGWGSLLTGIGGLANSLKSPETAQTPDYMALARLQAQLNQEAADRALAANRPDQVDAAGNTLTWTQDPTTGKWTQTQKLSAGNQALLNTSQQAQLDALRGVAGRGDFNFQGGPMMDPVGNSKAIQDAWMALLKPERDLALQGEIQRLKNQGLTEDSPAFQRAMLRQNQADTDAQNKALIAGTAEYGNQWARSLQGRQQQFGEYQTDYNAPMQQYQGLMGIAQPQGQFGNFTTTASTGGAPVYNAGQDQYTANLANANAKNAQNNNLTQGLFGLSGAIAKGGWGP